MLDPADSLRVAIGVLILSITAGAQDAAVSSGTVAEPVVAADAAPPLVTRFYDITLLTTSQPQFPFDDGSAGHFGAAYQFHGGQGGGMGGMGGGGGGGGFFSTPVEPAQFGGGSATPAEFLQPSLKQQLEERGESISDLIVSHVAADSWDERHGGAPEITELGHTLIIRQTESIHCQIEGFLKSLTTAVSGAGTYQVEAWWLPASEGDPLHLKTLLNGDSEESVVLEELTLLCQNEGGYHGILLCREKVTTHMASGKKVPVIVGSTPVVGTGSVGESPSVRLLHLGLMLQVRVTSIPDYMTSATDDVKSNGAELVFRSGVTSPDAQIQERSKSETVDRYILGEHSAEGSCRIRIGSPTLIASMTQLSQLDEETTERPPELQLVVRVTRNAD